ncbi:c-type cytochrome [Nitratifractor sp.]|uniref:c-type cytochrome n=1 Tax=Nitratifractor sp. TaxID=2268144 RepID=UPI0025EBCD94|nr:c-type cytochrome [Nitratifractor sp.]
MKKYFVLPIIVGALLLSGCSDRTKEKAKETAQSAAEDTAVAVQQAKEQSSSAMEEAKRQANEALEQLREKSKEAAETLGKKSGELSEKAKAAAVKAAASVEKKAAQIKEKLSSTDSSSSSSADGKALFAKCAGCHGVDGHAKALGKAPVIAGQKPDELARMLEEYRAGKRNAYGMGTVMHNQAAGLSDADIKALAGYIANLK